MNDRDAFKCYQYKVASLDSIIFLAFHSEVTYYYQCSQDTMKILFFSKDLMIFAVPALATSLIKSKLIWP